LFKCPRTAALCSLSLTTLFRSLADLAPADQPLAPPGGDADVQGGGRDDGPDVHPVALGDVLVAHLPAPLPVAHDAREAVVGAEGVAAGGDQIDHLLEAFPAQPRSEE